MTCEYDKKLYKMKYRKVVINMKDKEFNKQEIQKESDKQKNEFHNEAINTKTWRDYYHEILKAIAIFK